jgi:subfamily B ATP-binding cassette protein MsbA
VKKRRYTDLGLYRRLIGYLKGSRLPIFGVIACMFLEGVFTVTTITMVRPTLELLVKNRISDTSKLSEKAGFELGAPQSVSDGVYAMKAVGELAGSHAAEELHGALVALLKPPRKSVIVDLSALRRLDEYAWAQVYFGNLTANDRGIALTFVLPDAFAVPAGMASAGTFSLLPAGSAEGQKLLAGSLASVPQPVAEKPKKKGLVSRLKEEAGRKVAPYLERVQDYVMVSSANKFRVLGCVIGVMLTSAFFMVVASFGVGYLSAYLASLAVLRLRNHVYAHMLGLDLQYFSRHSTGTLMSSVTQDVAAVSGAIDILFSSVLKTPVTVMMLVAAMFFISPSLTLFCFAVVPIIGLMLYTLGRKIRKISQRIQELRAVLSSMAQETFSGIRVVKAFNMEVAESDRYELESRNVFKRGLKTIIAEELGTSLTALLGIVTVSVMILAGGYYVLQTRELSGSDFVLFVVFLSQVFRPLKGSSRVIGKIQKGMAGSDRVFRVLDTRPTIVHDPAAVELQPLRREITFDHVSFSYHPSRPPVLCDIDLRVPAGKAIAIVGETGAGKSTLVNLLPRFYDPTQGRVLFDGVDLREVSLRSLRDQIAVITQDVILFDETVARNIAYGMEDDVPRERIEAAARAANAHRFIEEKLPKGYDTLVGGRGTRLSGGERQRIAIARAILKDAPVLILDEATSSLDSETEALIQDALANVIKGRTVFVIAHRLSTIQNCDEILVMDSGKFVERGTHEELLRLGGRYARYHGIQFGKPVAV